MTEALEIVWLDAQHWILSAFVATVVAYIVAAVTDRKLVRNATRHQRWRLLGLFVGIAVIGTVAGTAGGTSRVGVVGDIIPAALALVGGASVYLFGVDASRGLIATCCAIAFTLALGSGYILGAAERTRAEFFAENKAFCDDLFGTHQVLTSSAAYCTAVQNHGEMCAQSWAQFATSETSRFTEDYGRTERYNDAYNAQMANFKGQILLRAPQEPACSIDPFIFDLPNTGAKTRITTLGQFPISAGLLQTP